MNEQDRKRQQEALENLAAAGLRLRERLTNKDTKELVWIASEGCPSEGVIRSKVGRGWLILSEPNKHGVPYTACFGANSDNSYSGLLPGVTMEEAKLLVYGDMKRYNK